MQTETVTVSGNQSRQDAKITTLRVTGLFCLFFLMAWGLGYPMLNRYDPRNIPGLSDVKSYAALVAGVPNDGYEHVQFRILVPWTARPFYRLARGRFGSWDPALFGLLAADSIFVALTAVLIVVLGARSLGNYAVSLLASLLYLVNFSVPNLRLVGLVDAGEGFFLLALLWSLSESAFWALPLIAALGTATKESFVPFSIVFTATWWIVERRKLSSPTATAVWLVCTWLFTFSIMMGIQWWVSGRLVSPISFADSLHYNHDYLRTLRSALWDRSFLYVFIWLLPTGIPHLRRLPKSWLISSASASAVVFVLEGYYGGGPGTVVRALFSTAGPVLALSSASFLLNQDTFRTPPIQCPE